MDLYRSAWIGMDVCCFLSVDLCGFVLIYADLHGFCIFVVDSHGLMSIHIDL